VFDQELTKGDEKRTIRLVALTGIGFTPMFVWTTNEQTPRLFAFIVPGYLRLIEEGWESNAAVLEARQKAAEQELLVDLSRRVAHPLAGKTLISNVRIFDSERAVVRGPCDVVLEKGRIVAIDAAGGSQRAGDHVIDGTGRVLLPGLFDMHVHVGFWVGGLHVAGGVTTVRDMANDNATLQQIIAAEQAGTLLSPQIVPTGFIEGESPSAARHGFVIKDVAEAKQAVDWYHEHRYGQIKIYNSFPKDILPEVTQYAHARGLRVSGHVPVFLRAEQAVLAGYDEIQHINQVLLNFLVDDKTDTRTLARFYLPAEKVADLDFDSQRVQDFIALLSERRIVVDPTLTAMNFIRHRDGVLSQAYTAIADHLPPDVRRSCLQGQMKIPDDDIAARYEKSFGKMIEFTGRMYRAGIPMVAGTDDLAGFSLHRELEFYVEAGITPAQVLQIATLNGAKYAGVLDDRGVITQGRRADLILTDGDPTQNISDIRKVALVIKGDVAYYPDEIHETLGIKPFATRLEIQDGRRSSATSPDR
jgi:cytosine/adenosine deaminase-related metal-dependent hydrolase